MAINYINLPRFTQEMILVKVCVYYKDWTCTDCEGKVHSGTSYNTLFGMVPDEEFVGAIPMIGKDNSRPNTRGVYVMNIGSQEGLIPTHDRVGLRTYQNHMEALGWRFLGTVPNCKGMTLETARSAAWERVKRFEEERREAEAKKRKDFETKQKLLRLTSAIQARADDGEDILDSILNLQREIEAVF